MTKSNVYIAAIKTATRQLERKEISVQDWIAVILGEEYRNVYSDEYCRRSAKIFSAFVEKLEQSQFNDIEDFDTIVEIKRLKDELKAERIKLQTKALEYNAISRAEARSDLFKEQIIQAVNRLPSLSLKKPPQSFVKKDLGASGLLCLADFHAGATYVINGLHGEVINSYDFNTMQSRMWYLLNQMESDLIDYDDLTIAILGDVLDNILRPSSLVKLQEPVVDTVIKFSEFMSEWIAEAHSRLCVPINVVIVGGNHDQNRLLTSKPQFDGENMSKIVREFLALRLADIDSVSVDEYTDCAFKSIRGTNILFEHGCSDILKTLNYFENLYNVSVDEIYCGHLHQQESKSVGIADVGDKMCYRVGSICGIDDFAKKIRRASRASASFATYTDDGHSWSKTYYLN